MQNKQNHHKRLTQKNIKFINELLSGKSQTEAYIAAYNTKGHKATVYAEASRTTRLPQVRQAIEEALEVHKLTPEYAVRQLKRVAMQDDNYGAKRAACKDILELWGVK